MNAFQHKKIPSKIAFKKFMQSALFVILLIALFSPGFILISASLPQINNSEKPVSSPAQSEVKVYESNASETPFVRLRVEKNQSGVKFEIQNTTNAVAIEIQSEEVFQLDGVYYFEFKDNFNVSGFVLIIFKDASVSIGFLPVKAAKGESIAQYGSFHLVQKK